MRSDPGSSDSDFTRLASRLKESGKRVYGFGEKKTPDFESRNYGYSKLSELLQASKHFEVRRQEKLVSVRRVK